MLVRVEGMECWMREKERPAKENAGKGGGNGMLVTKGKASKGEGWWKRKEWNVEWKTEGMECGMRQKEKPS
jgi:hypothetical protein